VDGAFGVDSLVAVAAVALLSPSALGLPPRLLVPQVVLLVDRIVIGLYVLGHGAAGPDSPHSPNRAASANRSHSPN
jgi:amino acid transporter